MRKAFVAVLLTALLAINIVVVKAFELGPNLEAKATKKIPPLYPPLAKRKRVEGKVTIRLEIGSEGTVSNAEFVEGNSLFKPSSLDAAKQWTFAKSMAGTTGHIVFKFQLEEKE